MSVKIVINMPYNDEVFNYARLINQVEEFLHQKLDSGKWDFEIYRLEDLDENGGDQ